MVVKGMGPNRKRSHFWILAVVVIVLLLGTVGYFVTLIVLAGDGDIFKAIKHGRQGYGPSMRPRTGDYWRVWAICMIHPERVNSKCSLKGGRGTPLHAAIHARNLRIVRLLIDRGADLEAKYANERTSLLYAMSYGDKETVALLIARGANVNGKGRLGRSPLHLVRTTDIAASLISKGANVNAKDNNGWTPLHGAAFCRYHAIVELLVAKGADVRAEDMEGRTPLHVTTAGDTVELLIAQGANVNARDAAGLTPLHRTSQKETIQALLAHGADLNAKYGDGETALHMAVRRNNGYLVRFLVGEGADVRAKNKDGKTPLDVAVEMGRNYIADFLRKHGAKKGAGNGP